MFGKNRIKGTGITRTFSSVLAYIDAWSSSLSWWKSVALRSVLWATKMKMYKRPTSEQLCSGCVSNVDLTRLNEKGNRKGNRTLTVTLGSSGVAMEN